MRSYLLLLLPSVAALAVSGCNAVECGDGTIERNGSCVPADETVGNATCGPFTELVGGQCVPMFPPTVCEDQTTVPQTDENGVTTCIGVGGSGCSAPIPCGSPTPGKQTICGRLFDFETDLPFAASGAEGNQCGSVTASGPCSVGIRAYDAIAFGSNPSTAVPLDVGETYIDDCGRFRLADITLPTNPFIGLGIDDANPAMMGPLGNTNIVGLATEVAAGSATRNIEAFVAPKSTTDKWAASGGPPLSGGILAMIFRAQRTGTAGQGGVEVTVNGSPISDVQDHYFVAGEATRATISAAANQTGANGTALVTGATLASGAFGGTGGLPAECIFTPHAGVALPQVLFVQTLRPSNAPGMTCAR